VAPGRTTELPYPQLTSNLHYECELVVAIGKGGSDIAVADALAHVFGYAVGLDMTRRDLQQARYNYLLNTLRLKAAAGLLAPRPVATRPVASPRQPRPARPSRLSPRHSGRSGARSSPA